MRLTGLRWRYFETLFKLGRSFYIAQWLLQMEACRRTCVRFSENSVYKTRIVVSACSVTMRVEYYQLVHIIFKKKYFAYFIVAKQQLTCSFGKLFVQKLKNNIHHSYINSAFKMYIFTWFFWRASERYEIFFVLPVDWTLHTTNLRKLKLVFSYEPYKTSNLRTKFEYKKRDGLRLAWTENMSYLCYKIK